MSGTGETVKLSNAISLVTNGPVNLERTSGNSPFLVFRSSPILFEISLCFRLKPEAPGPHTDALQLPSGPLSFCVCGPVNQHRQTISALERKRKQFSQIGVGGELLRPRPEGSERLRTSARRVGQQLVKGGCAASAW